MCYFILTKFSTVNRYCYCNLFLKSNNQCHILKIQADIFRLMTPSWLGWGGLSCHSLFVASYVPRKVFISQPGLVSSALQSLQAHVELLFPVSLCPPVTPPHPKTKRNHSESLESTILSCLWALHMPMLFPCRGPQPNSHLSPGLRPQLHSTLHPAPSLLGHTCRTHWRLKSQGQDRVR